MSLVKRPNSKFWYVQFQIEHRTVVRSTKTTDRRVAEKVAAKLRQEIHEELVLGKKRPLTLAAALERFIGVKSDTPNERNLRCQARMLNRIVGAATPLTSITNETVDLLISRRTREGCSAQTIKHGVNCLIGAISAARKGGYATAALEAPTIRVQNGRLRYLTVEEELRLLAELDPTREGVGLAPIGERSADQQAWIQDNFDIVVLLLDTGARYGEIANIRWKQVDLRGRRLHLWRSKTRNESVIFLTERAFEILHRRRSNAVSEFVFSNKAGRSRGYSAVSIRKAFRRAGLSDCTIHTLRHTHASRLIQNGLTVYEVREVLGHSDIKTTMRYAHLERADVTRKARDVIERLNRSSG